MSDQRIAKLLEQHKRLSVIGIDDSPFERGRRAQVLVSGVVCRDTRFEGLLTTRIRQDGWNATERLIQMVQTSKFRPQLHVVLVDGIALGGLNVVDLQALAEGTGLPCLAVMRKAPDLAGFFLAIERLPRAKQRLLKVQKAGPIHQGETFCFQVSGLNPDLARRVLTRLTVEGHVPEPLRLAHLIGGALVTGQSGRRA